MEPLCWVPPLYLLPPLYCVPPLFFLMPPNWMPPLCLLGAVSPPTGYRSFTYWVLPFFLLSASLLLGAASLMVAAPLHAGCHPFSY